MSQVRQAGGEDDERLRARALVPRPAAEATEAEGSPYRVFAYVLAERAGPYLDVVDALVVAKERFRLQLRPRGWATTPGAMGDLAVETTEVATDHERGLRAPVVGHAVSQLAHLRRRTSQVIYSIIRK